MIYEFTRATIKHNFPRAVLMTCWERYFIMAAAPRTDRGTEAVGTKNKMLSSNWRKFGGWWVTETREVTGNASRRLQLVTHTARRLQIQMWGRSWGLHGSSLKAKVRKRQWNRDVWWGLLHARQDKTMSRSTHILGIIGLWIILIKCVFLEYQI